MQVKVTNIFLNSSISGLFSLCINEGNKPHATIAPFKISTGFIFMVDPTEIHHISSSRIAAKAAGQHVMLNHLSVM